jgi:hypothetical protein
MPHPRPGLTSNHKDLIMPITPIARGTTRSIAVRVKTFKGTIPDISADTVTLTVKKRASDTDAQAKLQKDADVTTAGASGIAAFELTIGDTDFEPGKYLYDVIWYRGVDEEYLIERGILDLIARVSDV